MNTELQVLRHVDPVQNKHVEVVTPEILETRPYPLSMGRLHRPIKYSDIVGALDDGLKAQGVGVLSQELILARGGKLLMATYHVKTINGGLQLPGGLPNALLLALMASENQITACKARVGIKIFMCENLTLSGGEILISHKFTTKAQIINRIWEGIKKWLSSTHHLEERLQQLNTEMLTDAGACTEILQVAAGSPKEGTRGVVPFKYAQKAYDEYFDPKGEDTNPRTRWGLLNSWTRALRDAPPQSKLTSTVAVSGYYKA